MSICHAWWSDSMIAQGCGTVIWATADGKQIETCYVTETSQQHSNWPDMVYLGEVTRFLAPGRPSRYAERYVRLRYLTPGGHRANYDFRLP